MATDIVSNTFTFSGTAYAAVIGPPRKSKNLEMAGYLPENAMEIIVQTSLFTGTRPAVGDTVTVSSVIWRIITLETCEADTALVLLCEAKQA